jgi:hypothetical protein
LFLSLVHYLAWYLLKLANYTVLLTPFTMKEAHKDFPIWTVKHQTVFEAIKALISHECLMVIDHNELEDNKVFVTCNASDWRTGAQLSFRPTWELAWPVAFDSMQLKGAEKNYLVPRNPVQGRR